MGDFWPRACDGCGLVPVAVKAIGLRKTLGAEPAAENVLGLVEELAQIADEVSTFAARHEVRPAPKNDPIVVGSWIALVAAGVLGFVMLIAGALERNTS